LNVEGRGRISNVDPMGGAETNVEMSNIEFRFEKTDRTPPGNLQFAIERWAPAGVYAAQPQAFASSRCRGLTGLKNRRFGRFPGAPPRSGIFCPFRPPSVSRVSVVVHHASDADTGRHPEHCPSLYTLHSALVKVWYVLPFQATIRFARIGRCSPRF
jgi:hypothetical protein